MHLIHEGHEIARRPVTRRGSKEFANAGRVRKILGKRHQLHMRISHLLDVGDQLCSKLGIAVASAVAVSPPGTDLQLIHMDRLAHQALARKASFAVGKPSGVPPLIAIKITDYGCGARRLLGPHAVRIGFLHLTRTGADQILVIVSVFDALDRDLPHAARTNAHHWMPTGIPAVEVADHRHEIGARSPNAKHGAPVFAVRAKEGKRAGLPPLVKPIPHRRGDRRYFVCSLLFHDPFAVPFPKFCMLPSPRNCGNFSHQYLL